jgi:LacI family gluconate utilization system Gnt-I transcriptional repressor
MDMLSYRNFSRSDIVNSPDNGDGPKESRASTLLDVDVRMHGGATSAAEPEATNLRQPLGGGAEALTETLSGVLERVTYHNAENGFCVLRVKACGQRDLVVAAAHVAVIIAVQKHVAIAGFNGFGLGELVQPSLTTIVSPRQQIGQIAVKKLIARIRGQDGGPACIDVGFSLLVGGST